LRDSVLGGSSVIYDHAYYWPHFTAIPAAADKDVMIFTMSKISGHASSRFGYKASLSLSLSQIIIELLVPVPSHTRSKLHDKHFPCKPNSTDMVPHTISFPPYGSSFNTISLSRWAFIKDENVYNKVSTYMGFNSLGMSRDTQMRMLKIVKVILANIGSDDEDIFKFAFNKLNKRWQRLNEIVNYSSRFSLQQLSPQYCTYFEKIRDPSPG
jgi:Allinase